MDRLLRGTAETAARLLLRSFRTAHPEWLDEYTPLDMIVSWLGLQVETFHPEDYPTGTYGFTDADEEENLIWLRRNMAETLRRFTLAHELGHILLHWRQNQHIQARIGEFIEGGLEAIGEPSRSDPCYEKDVQERVTGLLEQEQFEETLGIGHSYDPRSQREIAANIFAAELLMPLERLRALYLDQGVPAQTLTVRFGVSQTAMLNRLAAFMTEKSEPAVEATSGAAEGPLVPSADDALASSPAQAGGEAAPKGTGKKRYDEFQQAAIEAQTPSLIVAGPGSGKTSTLIGRVSYLVQEMGVEPQQILALTFSRKAAGEMEERLQQVLSGPLPKVSTFHAFCADLLRRYGEMVGLRADFSLVDEAEGYFILRQQAGTLHLRHYQMLQAPTYYFPDMLKAISRAKDELVSPEAYAEMAQRMREQAGNEEGQQQAEKALEVARVYGLYEQALRRRGDTDFGGLLMLTVELFRRFPNILWEQQQTSRHILVDEFQDVNRASGVLLRELAGPARNAWVVGDANQAIYSFRGASPANISQFEEDFPGAVILPLSRNYRSLADLVMLAETFRCRQLELGEEVGKNQPVRRIEGPQAVVTLARASDERCEMAGLVQDMREKHAQGYTYRDMVVLCRTRSQAQKITRKLAAEGLPVIERGSMLEQEHIKDVLSVLLLLCDGSGMGLLRAARQYGLTQEDIEALLLAARQQNSSPRMLMYSGELPLTISAEGRRAFERLGETLQALQRVGDVWSVLAQYLLIETGLVRERLRERTEEQRAVLADYEALLRLGRHFDQQWLIRLLQDGLEEEESLEERLKGFIEYLGLLVLLRQDGGNRQSSEEEKSEAADIIRVMTVHASKGLEFPVVYLPGLSKRRFPLQAKSSPISAPAGMLPEEGSGPEAHESGESCLFYVGITRARDQLVLSYSERYGKQKYQRSPYLDALEAGLVEERISRLVWDERSTGVREGDEQEEETPLTSSQPSAEFVNAMRPGVLSAAMLEAYQRCPRQYAYSQIYRFAPEADGYRLFWQATQKTVEALHTQMREQSEQAGAVPTQREIQEMYTRHWQELGGHISPFASMYEAHGHEIVEGIRRQLLRQEETQWNMRHDVEVDIAGRAVRVTIDRVEFSTQSESPRFVRARFGKRKEKPSVEMRELLYTLAYRQKHAGQEVEVHSHNMSTGEVQPVKITARKEQTLYEEARQSIEGLERNAYPAQPAEPYRCPSCPFFLICPA